MWQQSAELSLQSLKAHFHGNLLTGLLVVRSHQSPQEPLSPSFFFPFFHLAVDALMPFLTVFNTLPLRMQSGDVSCNLVPGSARDSARCESSSRFPLLHDRELCSFCCNMQRFHPSPTGSLIQNAPASSACLWLLCSTKRGGGGHKLSCRTERQKRLKVLWEREWEREWVMRGGCWTEDRAERERWEWEWERVAVNVFK